MIRLVAAELLKLRTTRTSWALAGATLVLIVLITVLTLALSDGFATEEDVRSVLSTAGVSGLLLLVLGVVASAGEYRHGTIAATLLVTPDRLRVVAAQALACALAGLATGLAAAALTAAIGLPWLSARDAPALSAGELLGLFLGGAVYTALAAALGAAVGALLRNQVAAVVLVLVLLFIVDPTLAAVWEGYAAYSLNGLGVSMSGGSADDLGASELLPFGLAALLWAGYTAVLVGGPPCSRRAATSERWPGAARRSARTPAEPGACGQAIRAHPAEPGACGQAIRAHPAEPGACGQAIRAHPAEPGACGQALPSAPACL